MIVRVATEGQYELDGEEATLNELDNEVVAAAETGDNAQFRTAFERLLDFVRTNGKPVPEGELRVSDVIVPPPDISIDEARADFTGEGLIPG